jgi:hypothetical protein
MTIHNHPKDERRFMKNITDSQNIASHRINRIEVTNDTLTSRAGLTPFVRYLEKVDIYPHLDRLFGSLRKNKKSNKISDIFKQLFCFLADGTSRHITRFDELKKDEGYAAGIECSLRNMLSSHSVKRFYRKFYHFHYFKFRELLQKLFIWRLRIDKPSIIILGIDTMVMDNNDAQQRHGVKPTYKKVKGFQPLQLNWMGFMIDAVFRGGDKHSNHSDTVNKMIMRVVRQIRKHYSAEVPIILRCDRGFFDQKLFHLYEGLGIGFICGGKRYQDIKDYVSQVPRKFWPEKLEDNNSEWSYLEFGDCRKSWDRFRRAFFCTLNIEDGQYIFDFAKQDTVIYTNIGLGDDIDRQLIESGHEDMLKTTSIIKCYHNRGNDELVNRAVKDFASEKLPFKQFRMNAAYYYTMLTAFFLLEAFKQDTCEGIIPMTAYSTTIRRRLFDIAGKIVRHSGEIILKVTTAVMESLKLDVLWRRCNNPPLQFTWV